MDKTILKILTFGCRNEIYIYPPQCWNCPNPPYTNHNTIKEAEHHLKSRGVKNILKVIYPSRSRDRLNGNKQIHQGYERTDI